MSATTAGNDAPTRSSLLMNARRGTLNLSAWCQTVSDWGCTPATPQNTTTAPSSTRSERSTSIVKSTWPGRVDQVDLVLLPLERGRGRGDRDPALALLLHPVHLGLAVVDLADLVDLAGVEQEPLRHGGLAGVDMGDDAEVADQIDLRHRYSGARYSAKSIGICALGRHGHAPCFDRARRRPRDPGRPVGQQRPAARRPAQPAPDLRPRQAALRRRERRARPRRVPGRGARFRRGVRRSRKDPVLFFKIGLANEQAGACKTALDLLRPLPARGPSGRAVRRGHEGTRRGVPR